MKMIPQAKNVILYSYAMWASYIGLLCLIVPEFIFWLSERDTDPKIWWYAGIFLIIVGIVGRVIDQSGGRRTLRSPAIVAFLVIAVPLVSRWEGKENQAYLDRIANPPVWTVCHGETRGVKQGDFYTDAECNAMLEKGLLEYRAGLHKYFTDETKAHRLTAARDAAYVSLAWNVGITGSGKSTATRRLNAGNIAGGCKALTWWNRAGKRIVRGLVNRRAAEYTKCMSGLT